MKRPRHKTTALATAILFAACGWLSASTTVAHEPGEEMAEAAALFVVRGGTVAGFRGDGDRISEQISGILLTAEIDSSLTGPVATGIPFRGPAPEDGIDARILHNPILRRRNDRHGIGDDCCSRAQVKI